MQTLGVSSGTCRHFGSGLAPESIMRGRLAIPIGGRDGRPAYCGRVVDGGSSSLIFPNGFDPR
ncbi:hypothetical protein J8J23_21535, partial [Mycobacterium tuberculosis]|uniref:hypothetical protein n=1 Tax=Mycobacterium tuberculosis TaxID=1773 RepID=UPI001AE06CA1